MSMNPFADIAECATCGRRINVRNDIFEMPQDGVYHCETCLTYSCEPCDDPESAGEFDYLEGDDE